MAIQLEGGRPVGFVPLSDIRYSIPSARMRSSNSPVPSPTQEVPALIKDALYTLYSHKGLFKVHTRKLTGGEHHNKGTHSLTITFENGESVQHVGKVGDFPVVQTESRAYDALKQGHHVTVLYSSAEPTKEGMGVLILENHGGDSAPTFRSFKKVNAAIVPQDAVRFQRRISRDTAEEFRLTYKIHYGSWYETNPRKIYSMQWEEFEEVKEQMMRMKVRNFPDMDINSGIIIRNGESTQRHFPLEDMVLIREMDFLSPFYGVAKTDGKILDLDNADKNYIFNAFGVGKKIDLEMVAEQIDPAERVHVENKHVMGATAEIVKIQTDVKNGSLEISSMHVNFSHTAYLLEMLTWKEVIPYISTVLQDPNFPLRVLKYRMGSYLHEAAYAKTKEQAALSLLLASRTLSMIALVEEQIEQGLPPAVKPDYLFDIPGIYVKEQAPVVRARR